MRWHVAASWLLLLLVIPSPLNVDGAEAQLNFNVAFFVPGIEKDDLKMVLEAFLNEEVPFASPIPSFSSFSPCLSCFSYRAAPVCGRTLSSLSLSLSRF